VVKVSKSFSAAAVEKIMVGVKQKDHLKRASKLVQALDGLVQELLMKMDVR
jgi:hypothetical protein